MFVQVVYVMDKPVINKNIYSVVYNTIALSKE